MGSKNLIIFSAIIFLSFSGIFTSDVALTKDGQMFNEFFESSSEEGTKWAVLVAGSNNYYNYRHQADICHAYHIFKKGGLKDENIIVFMYDDIAYNEENPRKGVIINNPKGKDVYAGVPKDYIGKAVNPENLYAVILGNKTATKGGSGKVVNSGPNDHIFIYYADHGGPGVLGMPDGADDIYAIDLIYALMKKHTLKSYKKMVIYVEACESGSIFDGLLPNTLNIYVSTAANPEESSYGAYCGDEYEPPNPKGYEGVCLGDVFSVSWLEDSDRCNPMEETLEEQYVAVKHRTWRTKGKSSHVMQYGNRTLSEDVLAAYLIGNSSQWNKTYTSSQPQPPPPLFGIDQRDADLVYFKHKVRRAREGSNERAKAQKELDALISHRKHVDRSVEAIGKALFGEEESQSMMNFVRPQGQALVDDWGCLKAMVKTYEEHCGSLKDYGKKYMRAFANICNAGVKINQVDKISTQVCHTKKLN